MPDFERRSSASFISSKEGGTPLSFRRSLMNRSSSYCLRVSISTYPQFAFLKPARCPLSKLEIRAPESVNSCFQTQALETNHERTLYVPYVFRNHLISGQQTAPPARRARSAPRCNVSPAAAGRR